MNAAPDPPTAPRTPVVRDGLSLFLCVILVNLVVAGGRVVSSDEAEILSVTLWLAWLVDAPATLPKYAPGQSLLELPFVLVARLLGAGADSTVTTVFLLPALLGGLAAYLLYELGIALGQKRRAALIGALAFALGSPALVYATRLFSEMAQAVALVGAALALIRMVPGSERRSVFLVGLWWGALFALKPFSAVLVAVPLGATLLWRLRAAQPRALLAGIAGSLPGVIAVLLFNAMRSGSPFNFAYGEGRDALYGFTGDVLGGVYGLTLSPGVGLFVYMPLAALALPGLVRLGSRRRDAALLVASVPVLLVVGYAGWWAWHGGWCWGPRLVVPALAFLALGVGEVWMMSGSTVARVLTSGLLAVSVLLQLPGIAVSSTDYARAVFASCHERFPPWQPGSDGPVDDQLNVHFIAAFMPVRGHAWMALERISPSGRAAPWDGLGICREIRVPPEPLEVWWMRRGGGSVAVALLAGVAAAVALRRALGRGV